MAQRKNLDAISAQSTSLETYTMNWWTITIRESWKRCCRNTTTYWMFRDDFGECHAGSQFDGRKDRKTSACKVVFLSVIAVIPIEFEGDKKDLAVFHRQLLQC